MIEVFDDSPKQIHSKFSKIDKALFDEKQKNNQNQTINILEKQK